ncbi:hypothetical protein DRN63_04435 [Nanoarchaeota archaeon]|nr:MAG: hypothetical protein DRN63_04435 [Nanoarchaeota archaeon]
MKVIIDSNLIIWAFKHRIDIKDQMLEILPEGFELLILRDCLREIERSGKVKPEVLKEYLKSWGIRVVDYESSAKGVDSKILEYAKKNRGCVATLDADLRRRARKLGLHLVYLHNNRLEFL